MHRPINKLLLPLLAALPLVSFPCFAERADSEKPVHLEADQVLIDDAKKISTFTGNVKYNQGTLLIQGDKIIIIQDKDGFKHCTVYGNTASFRQKREGFDEYVEGFGERIEYDTRTETVDFHGQARLKRELDEVRGEMITYTAKSEIFQVNGNPTKQDKAPSKRVRAILQSKSATRSTTDTLPIKASGTLQPDN